MAFSISQHRPVLSTTKTADPPECTASHILNLMYSLLPWLFPNPYVVKEAVGTTLSTLVVLTDTDGTILASTVSPEAINADGAIDNRE